MKKNKFYLLILFWILSGCSLAAIGPNAYVESPENISSQTGRSELFVRAEPAGYFYMADNAAARPLVASPNPLLKTTAVVAPGMSYVFSDRIEIGLTANPMMNLLFWQGFSYFVRPSIKFQLLGDTGEKTLSTGSRLAVYANSTWSHMNTQGNQKEFGGEGGYPWATNSDFTAVSAGISYGYRVNTRWLFYVGAAHQAFQADGRINQEVSKTGDYPAAEYKFAKTGGHSSTMTIGTYGGVNKRFHMFYSYSANEWAAQTSGQHFLGLGFSILNFFKDPPTLEPSRVD